MLGRIIGHTWNTLVQVYKEYSLECTIHGIKYTTTAKSSTARLFWVVTLITSVIAAEWLAKVFYRRHDAASITTLIMSDHFPSWKFALPAVTLCSGSIAVTQKVAPYLNAQKQMYLPHGISRDAVESSLQYLREAIHPKHQFPEEMEKLQHILAANRLSLRDLFREISPNCTDLLLMCQYEGESVPCERLARSIITPYGVCCAINYDDTLETLDRHVKPKIKYRSANFGENFVLSLVIKSYAPADTTASTMYGDGMYVIVHERYTRPTQTAFHFVAAAGHETIARLRTQETVSSSEILNLPARIRGCARSTAERHYRADNCYARCREITINKLCGCTFFATPVLEPRQRECNLTHGSCLSRVLLSIHHFTALYPECDCLPNCEGPTYAATVAALPLNAIQYHPGRIYKVAGEHPNSIILHLTHDNQSGKLLRRELTMSIVNLISSLGSVFGLFLGCSFISVIEIFYFFGIYFVRKLLCTSR